MKKQLVKLIMLAAIAALMAACAPKETPVADTGMPDEYKDAPSWVFNPELEGGVAAVGTARIGKAGFAFARNEALADGRDQLARQMSVKVQNMVKNFTQATGMGDDETVDRVSSQVSRQVANETLAGSKMRSMWRAPNGELFVWMVVDPESVRSAARDAVTTSYKNDQALWQQFQAKKAHDELDAMIAKEFTDFN
ncbi:LPP20 family lipoprotein [Desulfobotulus sp. H1]|uniref:LPP20 family lipoprotein n=1 Tax=Desulfobotulus pelophilus TaxID=2823377 RepID=A0ABT3N768_9BACT|nr:LPP20 family lipoprotein [Desulfobotulus pelophilus]MCW7753306.1 LPP20 family lipoprotein [Desulfobotulus pelophilus]